MQSTRIHILVGAMVVVAVVAGSPVASATDPEYFGAEQWRLGVEARGVDPGDVIYPFTATDEMRRWAEEKLKGYRSLSPTQQLKILQHELFNPLEFEFSYEDNRTLTGREAFDARRGNCMSFTSLFVAMSRSIDIPTVLVTVRRAPEVDKQDNLVVVNRHVVAGYRGVQEMSLFDFYVTSAASDLRSWIIDDVQASALFHTNLGGMAIRDGDLGAAEHHLEIATRLDPDWAPGWVNLGVARYRSGDPEGAMTAYEHALEAEPGNSSAWTNIALIHRDQGREEASRTALQAATDGRSNPFTLIALADVEMSRGDLDAAAKYLRRAKWWYREQPAVYDALARLERLRGDTGKAERHASRAAELRAESHRADRPAPAG